MQLSYSIIIPVYNRPDEIDELLQSCLKQTYKEPYEIVIVEDGSTLKCDSILNKYEKTLQISYFFKENSGPGDSRNYGMMQAKGNYFIILDSDCILPEEYLFEVDRFLKQSYVDCFGGPDAAHPSFTNIQKAISYSMTSYLTTGGIRGRKHTIDKFQPRSFNMGLSKKVFELTKGFGNIHPGEDPDLTIRIWNAGFDTALIEKAYVYHKRRISWKKFYKQIYKFGLARPVLNTWHPASRKITYWFPSFFILGFLLSIFFYTVGFELLLWGYIAYFVLLMVDSLFRNKSIIVALFTLIAVMIQFVGYGAGFLRSIFLLRFGNKEPEKLLPELFFD